MRSLMNQNESFREQPQTRKQRKPLPNKERGQLHKRESDETVVFLSMASFDEKRRHKGELIRILCCHSEFASACLQECIGIVLIVKMGSSCSA